MLETIGHQEAAMGAVGDEFKTATPPPPLAPREPLTPAQVVAGPDISQMQEVAGYRGWLVQAFKKIKAAVGLQGPTL